MLKRVGSRGLSGKTEIFIKEASFPVPFQPGLEFNSPAHGNWNIVHTGMLVPEARQIYVCADNCMRGVVLTAAEMNAADRFSFVIVEEKDLLGGNLEDVTIEGVTDILNRLDESQRQYCFLPCVFIIFWEVIWTASTENWKKDFRRSFLCGALWILSCRKQVRLRIRSCAVPCMMQYRRGKLIRNVSQSWAVILCWMRVQISAGS